MPSSFDIELSPFQEGTDAYDLKVDSSLMCKDRIHNLLLMKQAGKIMRTKYRDISS